MFFDCSGMLLHANRTMAGLFENSPDGEWIRSAVQHFADTLCSVVRYRKLEQTSRVEPLTTREVPTENKHYRLKGSFIGLDLFGRGPSTLVAVEQPAPDPLSDAALRNRFGLSKKESGVLRLLVEGKTNNEIAQILYLSPHTVRRHTTHVFHKLDVHSRAEAAMRVLRR